MSNKGVPDKNLALTYYIFFTGLLVSIILLASVPPTSRDALIHHLAIPKLYLKHGGIYEIPNLIFTYYPMNLDLLYMGALRLGSDILPKYLHMFFGLSTAVLLYHYLKKNISVNYARLGTIFFLSTPIIIKLSITIYVDLGLVFFSTAGLLLIFKWAENNFNTKYILTAGVCCGLAMGTKYNGLIVFFLLTCLIPVIYINNSKTKRNSLSRPFLAAILFCCIAILVASPWYIKNMIWTGNPVFPLYDTIFNPTTISATKSASSDSIRGVFATRHVLYGENIWQLLLLPVRIFFEGSDNNPRYFDGRLNPFLLLLPLFAFFRKSAFQKRVNLEKLFLAAFCILYFLFAFNTSALRIRYLAPIVPILVVLAMYGLSNIEAYLKHYSAQIATIVLLLPITIMLAWNGSYIYQQYVSITPFNYILGNTNRDAYLTNKLPEYKVMKYANSHLPESSKILCVLIGWRGYYLDRDHVFDHQKNQDGIIAWLQMENISTQKIVQRLEAQNISHILIRTDLFDHWVHHNVTDENKETLTQLITDNLTPLTTNYNYTLFEIDT